MTIKTTFITDVNQLDYQNESPVNIEDLKEAMIEICKEMIDDSINAMQER